MLEHTSRVSLLVLYQLIVLVGILLMPFALFARRFGVNLPVHRLVERVDRTYSAYAEPAGGRTR